MLYPCFNFLLWQPYLKSEVKKWSSDVWAMLSTQYLLTCDKKHNGHEVCGAAHVSLWKSENNMGSSCEFAFCPLFVSARSRAGVLTMIRLIKYLVYCAQRWGGSFPLILVINGEGSLIYTFYLHYTHVAPKFVMDPTRKLYLVCWFLKKITAHTKSIHQFHFNQVTDYKNLFTKQYLVVTQRLNGLFIVQCYKNISPFPTCFSIFL